MPRIALVIPGRIFLPREYGVVLVPRRLNLLFPSYSIRRLHSMQPVHVNIAAFVVAVVIKQALGALWFSPVMFGPSWMQLTGCSEDKMKRGMAKGLAIDVVGGLVMAFVLLHAVVYAGATSVAQGIGVGFANWIGLAAVATLPMVTFEQRPVKLWLIYNAYFAIVLMIMGAIFATWR